MGRQSVHHTKKINPKMINSQATKLRESTRNTSLFC